MSILFRTLAFAMVLASALASAKTPTISVTGVVRDEQGRPAPDVEVASFWRANGSGRQPDGTPFDFSKEADQREFWGNIGQMSPRRSRHDKTDGEGRFRFDVRVTHHALIAMDAKREMGGIAVLPPPDGDGPLDVEIRLKPLVRVSGRFDVPETGEEPTWSHIYILVPPTDSWPLSNCRVAHCGSFEDRFEVALPPGKYQIWAYGSSPGSDGIDLAAEGLIDLVVPEGRQRLDVGTIPLTPAAPDALEAARRSEEWNETESLAGKPAPEWRVDFARGIHRDARLADYRGRWILLYFWNRYCVPCVTQGIPELMELSKSRDSSDIPFEIVTFYLDWEGEIDSIEELNRELLPLEQHVWKMERPFPLPVAVDSAGGTYARYGAYASGVSVLINPEGVVVPGGLAAFKKMLKPALVPREAIKPSVDED